MLPQADAYILLLLDIAQDQALHDLRAAKTAKRRKAVSLALETFHAAHDAYDAYWDATVEDRIRAPMRERIEAAAVGQPEIVQRALREGVSRNWARLTKQELRQLRYAVKQGLLVVINDSFGVPQYIRSLEIQWGKRA